MGSEPTPSKHKNPWGGDCTGRLKAYSLGHEFQTDVVKLEFRDWIDFRPGFWFSLLYGLLEGVSGALDVERRDIDGCLYTPTGSPGARQLILLMTFREEQDMSGVLPRKPLSIVFSTKRYDD